MASPAAPEAKAKAKADAPSNADAESSVDAKVPALALSPGNDNDPASYPVTAELIANCQAKTDAAIAKLTIAPPPRSHLRPIAQDFLEMARDYRNDSDFFLNKGEGALALEAVAYAHGWLDAGARLGLFEVGEDDQLFTLAE